MPAWLARHSLWLVVLGLTSCCAAVGVVEAAQQVQLAGVTAVQQQDGKQGLLVPLAVRHGVLRQQGRQLLKHGAITPVLGAVHQGYFYAQLLLGTPPKTYSVIIDTGSSITYIPCSKCKKCRQHMAAPFDPSKSNTARWLGCKDQQCQCGTPACSCRDQTCYYTRHYAEESSSEGWLVADKLHLPVRSSSSSAAIGGNSTRTVDIVFGCENVETGEIYKQSVDGVMGMGNNINSLPQQLARSGVIENTFALCYGFPEGGSMLLGDLAIQPQPSLTYTPFVQTPHNYYTIATKGITLGGKKLAINPADFSKGYGSVLDSGTTFTYLPTSAFKAFYAALQQAVQGTNLERAKNSDSYNDVCWLGAPDDWAAVNKLFPSGNITFAGGAYIELLPYRYLFKMDTGQYCLGVFDNGWQGTLLGGIITRNVLVQYDKEKNQVGFGHTDCNAIKPAAQGRPASQAAADETNPAQPDEHADKADTHNDDEADQQQQQDQQSSTPAPSDTTTSSSSSSSKSAADHAAQSPPEHQAAAGPVAEEKAADSVQGGDSDQPPPPAHSSKLLWVGVAVAAVLVIAIIQLAFATLWQPPPGSSKGGSNGGGLLPRAFGGERSSYQQVGTADDQELAELSEQTRLVQGVAPSLPVLQLQQQGSGQASPRRGRPAEHS